MAETTLLAAQAAKLHYEDLPPEVVEKAKLLILDQLGCQIAFSTLPGAKDIFRYTQSKQGFGPSTVVYYGAHTTVEEAVFCNAVFGHGFEMDDTEMQTTSHPAVAVVPVVLALGEALGKSGPEVLCAMVAGYETMLRFAHTADSMRFRNFHATSISGAFGAAAAAGWLLGFDELKMRDALGIAASLASGNTEYSCSGGTIKRLLGAIGATAGLKAALLAQAGITGSAEALEGKKGLLKGLCAQEPDLSFLRLPFEERWMILDVGNKPYCCCAGQHSVIDATEALRSSIAQTSDIAAIRILQREREAMAVGHVVLPADVIEAQFCARFACALRLVKGANGFHEYTLESIQDPEIQRLIAATTYVQDDEGVLAAGDGPARVTITLTDGQVLEEEVAFALGSKQKPMSQSDIEAKFEDLVSRSIRPDQAATIERIVGALDSQESLSALMHAVVA